jgi:hypothetical protein
MSAGAGRVPEAARDRGENALPAAYRRASHLALADEADGEEPDSAPHPEPPLDEGILADAVGARRDDPGKMQKRPPCCKSWKSSVRLLSTSAFFPPFTCPLQVRAFDSRRKFGAR